MLQDKSPRKPQNVIDTKSPSRFNRKYVARQPSVRQCTLVKTVPATEMPTQIDPNTEIKYKKEVELVSEKVTKTRHEIEQLKAQLQQLITEGITKTDFTETKQNLTGNNDVEISNKDKINEIKAKHFKDNVADTFKGDIIEKKLTASILKPTAVKQPPEEPYKKVRHYDQEQAREYIKKQREKRKDEEMRNKKEVISTELKKQRLQELREKSLRLLMKNIEHNRARSRSREPLEKVKDSVEHKTVRSRSHEAGKNEKVPENITHNPLDELNIKTSPEIPKLAHPHFQNITIRSVEPDHVNEINTKELRQKSAVQIQSAFRGYRQRKIYEELKRRKRQKPLREQNVSREVQTYTDFHIPQVKPYPYNFINAVKRKLNLVTQQPAKISTVDAAIQSSLTGELKSPNVDLKSFLSHKCLELEPLQLFSKKSISNQTVTLENGCVSESDTSKNIPELSSESSISESLKKSVHSTKRSHSSDSDKKLTISVEGIKKLKLKQPKSLESEISEHLNEAIELSQRRDSIISSNKCNYVTNKSNSSKKSLIEELKSASVVSTVPEISDQKTYSMKEKDAVTHNSDNKENVSQVTTAQDRSIKSSSNYSSNFTSVTTDIPKLDPPKVHLKTSLPISSAEESDKESTKRLVANITIRPGEKSTLESKAQTNEIHLKFEAELHLLNDFNDSLRRVMAVEKSLLELHDQKAEAALNYATRDTQTSMNQQNQIASINYSRGSDLTEVLSIDKDLSIVTTGLQLSPFNSPMEESNSEVSIVKEKLKASNPLTGISLEMFEQLIKDEDARIENLKAILKIREKSLVDRTKGELAWLEIQKKNLRDAGQLQEISAIKKKQRGLLIKFEHERHEMQRLKQMQKAASKERKSVLREQRNMIKTQLAAGSTVTKIKRNTREEKRQSGPFKVYNIRSYNDSIMSETSVTRKSSITEEVVSGGSNHSQSIVSHISEELVLSEKIQIKSHKDSSIRTENVKRSLLMREAALQKRKKVAEELLQWHQRLLEEERKVTELELAASAIVNQVPTTKVLDEPMSTKQKFKGSQLNQLWLSLTGRPEKKFNDEEMYNMSQASLEKFCKNATKYDKLAGSHKRNRNVDVRKPTRSKTTIPIEDVTRSNSEYQSDFDSASITSAISEHNQSNDDSTLSNDDIKTVTEVTKLKSKDQDSEDNTSNINSINELKSAEESKLIETEPKLDSSTSSEVINQILSEIDKYLESQSTPNDIIALSTCDKSQVIDEVSDIYEPSSTAAESAIKSIADSDKLKTDSKTQNQEVISENELIESSSSEKVTTDTLTSFSDASKTTDDVLNLNNLDQKPISEINQTSNENQTKTNSILDEIILNSIDETKKTSSDISGLISNHTDEEESETHNKNESEYSSKTKQETDFVSLLEESNKSSAEDTTVSTASELNRVSESAISDSIQKPSSVQDGISVSFLKHLKLSSSRIDESTTISSLKDLNTSKVSDGTQHNKPSSIEEVTTATKDIEDLIKSRRTVPTKDLRSKISDDQTKSSSLQTIPSCLSSSKVKDLTKSSVVKTNAEDTTVNSKISESLVNSNSTSNVEEQSTITSLNSSRINGSSVTEESCEVSEDLKKLSPTHSNIFSDNLLTASIKKSLSNGDLPGNIRGTATSEMMIDTQKPVLDEPRVSIKEVDEKSSSETIASITEIEEDDVSVRISHSYSEDKDHDQSEPEVEVSKKDKSEKTEEIIPEKSSEESSEVKTEPHLLLSYGFIDQHKEKTTDVKKRVSEILADANISSPRGDRSPRLQDFYVTAYDVTSPNNSPETISPTDESVVPQTVFASNEVEELLKKQLEIEQEIKAIQQLQQKEQLPYLFVREIPNKPPPPYTPPVNVQTSIKGSVLPACENEIATISNATAQILHKAAVNKNIQHVTLTDNAKRILELKNNVEGQCYEFLFDLSKEFALDHYKHFEPESGPSWMHLQKRTKLAVGYPRDQTGLHKLLNKKLKQVLGYEVVKSNENFKHKWSGKKRDHVDDLLVVECQAEEAEWTNYDRDELIVKDELSKEIMNMLLSETGQVLNNILSKKKYLC